MVGRELAAAVTSGVTLGNIGADAAKAMTVATAGIMGMPIISASWDGLSELAAT